MRCPDSATVVAWVDGELAGETADGLAGHVDSCRRCRAVERAQRQVKRRTSQLGGPRPNAALLSALLTLPQVEHDRALRRAHRRSCGDLTSHDPAATRFRLLVAGVGAAAWLVAATWTAPAPAEHAPASPAPAEPTSVAEPVSGESGGMPLSRWDAIPASAAVGAAAR